MCDDMSDDSLLTTPTWEKYTVISHAIANMDVRHKRKVLSYIRSENSMDLLVPSIGLTLSEFAIFHLVHEKTGRSKKPSARS